MLKYFANLPVRKRVGILGIILGLLAIFAKDPYHRTEASVNVKELAASSVKEINEIGVKDLADWIIQGKNDYRLLDVRNKEKFDEYHIPTAECMPIHSIPESVILRNEKIYLYSDNQLLESQAWFLMKAMKYRSVSILDGGLEKWKSQILFPSLLPDATVSQKAEFEKIKEVSKFFGGHPQSGIAKSISTKRIMPKLNMPTKIVLKSSKKKKKREGC